MHPSVAVPMKVPSVVVQVATLLVVRLFVEMFRSSQMAFRRLLRMQVIPNRYAFVKPFSSNRLLLLRQ
jgi:hypothetical protein